MSDLDGNLNLIGYCIGECCKGCAYACCQCCLEAGCSACVAGCGEGVCCVATISLAILAAAVAAITMLAVALVVVRPVGVAVEDASLSHFSLLAASGNATAALAYDVSLAVAVRNRNWLVGAEHAAPLDAELLFGGQRFARVRIGGAGRRIRGGGKGDVYHVAAAGESADVALGSAGVAEFVRESTAGVFGLELRLFGEVRYPPHRHARRLQASCPLELSLSSATAPATFRKVKCV